MRFGLFYEHQLPRPWQPDDEHTMLQQALDQIELADRLGYDAVWLVEHHFLEEYSHSSAPEVFLGACSQRTKNIRLGHGIIQLPPGFNHPVRVAERVATLDQLSNGRVEFGSGPPSIPLEFEGFGVERAAAREAWREALDAITRMFVETPFAGVSGEHVRVPVRNVVPKPRQQPHPPLWTACGRRTSLALAAQHGLGALSFSFMGPDDARQWRDEYYAALAAPSCVPIGFSVNANFAVVQNMMCHHDQEEARARGLEGAEFLAFSLAHYLGAADHVPGKTDVWDQFMWGEFDAMRGRGGSEVSAGKREALLERGVGGLTAEFDQTVGTPEQLREVLRAYEAAGVDQMIFIMQTGRNRHEHVCESLELFAKEVMPEFKARAVEAEAKKNQDIAPTVEAALARREPARVADPDYHMPAVELE